MRVSNHLIRKYLCMNNNYVYNEECLRETIQKSKEAFYEKEAKEFLSGAEFLYQQSKYIRKRWWTLQGAVLLILWLLFEFTESSFYIRRNMGIAAPLFAVLLLPELWKNRNNATLEIEGASCYSLRQIYAARIYLFAMVDFLLLCLFFLATVLTGKMLLKEMMINFFLPYIVTCCICFRSFVSRKTSSEAFSFLLCIVWCAVWTRLILNEKLYGAISPFVWFVVIIVAILYLCYCIRKEKKNYREIWEVKSLWS